MAVVQTVRVCVMVGTMANVCGADGAYTCLCPTA